MNEPAIAEVGLAAARNLACDADNRLMLMRVGAPAAILDMIRAHVAPGRPVLCTVYCTALCCTALYHTV